MVSAGESSKRHPESGVRGEPAFEQWYATEYPRLVGVLIRLGAAREDAEDVAVESFSRALQQWSTVRDCDSPTAWLYRVALNLVRRMGRRRFLERRALARKGTNAAAEAVPVWDAVAALPHRQRTAVVLHYLLDLSYREVAAAMQVKEGTVAATLSAARRALERQLADPEDR
jgi:RNA polymerase sigma factor (sigma-70 family)